MCRGQFKESAESLISLPDDDPRVMRALIQYLYSGDFFDFGIVKSSGGTADAISQLSDIYITAEKYQMSDLKELIIKKLRAITGVEERPAEFFSLAQKIYSGIPQEGPNAFRDFLQDSIAQLSIQTMNKTDKQAFLQTFAHGGLLAKDLARTVLLSHHADLRHMSEKHSKDKKIIKSKEDQIKALKQQMEDQNNALKQQIEDLSQKNKALVAENMEHLEPPTRRWW